MIAKQMRWIGLVLGMGAGLLMLLFIPGYLSPSAAQDVVPTPEPPKPTVTFASQNMFQTGIMIWRQDTRQVYVMYDPTGEQCRGTVEVYTENWQEGQPETDPAFNSTMPGQFQPGRGMGQVWRNNPAVRSGLGYAKGIETGYTMLMYQSGNTTWLSGESHDVFIIEGNQWKKIDIASPVCQNSY